MFDPLVIFLIIGFILAAVLVAFCWYVNTRRDRFEYEFTLKPNCLLTRYPVVFLTGARSIFYFRRYWNSYPALLAEHGYEVFTLALPWKGSERAQQLAAFLKDHAHAGNSFHFVMDAATADEFSNLLKNSEAVLSQTIPSLLPAVRADAFAITNTSLATKKQGLTMRMIATAFSLHRLITKQTSAPSAADLGAAFPTGALALLSRMQELGEEDFLRS